MRGVEERREPRISSAGGVVGVIAAVVAIVYILGGLVVAARLRLDGVTVAETVAVVGQLSREFLITAAGVQVVATAVLVGLAAALVMVVWDLPSRVPPSARTAEPSRHHALTEGHPWPDLRSTIGGRRWLRAWMLVLVVALALITPAIVLLLGEDHQSWLEVATLAVAASLQFGAVLCGWFGLRTLRAGGDDRRRHLRVAALSGALCAAVALPAATMFAGFTGFENARVCLAGGTSITGALVADTKDAILLTSEVGDQEEETVVRVPTSQVTVMRYGADDDLLPSCPRRP
ncbi:MAG: hypothetical protein M3389_16840 [Actinomycetota bacterium]|nr:hypothetical protein [Actinomycetota bacterium]